MGNPAFQRVLIKLSGEALMGGEPFGIDPVMIGVIARQIQAVRDDGVEVAIVVGGGNFYRGAEKASALIDRATADYNGMLMTLVNATTLRGALKQIGVEARVLTAIDMPALAEPFILQRALRHFEKERVVIFAGGTGNPYFTTDTAAALRASEIGADALLMAKNGVEGIYSADPRSDPDAEFIPEISAREALERNLQVMDSNALALCSNNRMPIHVFDMDDPRALPKLMAGERVGTLVTV